MDIYQLVSTFFPNDDVYQDWLNGEIEIIKCFRGFKFVPTEDIKNIKKLYSSNRLSIAVLSKQYDLSWEVISEIVKSGEKDG